MDGFNFLPPKFEISTDWKTENWDCFDIFYTREWRLGRIWDPIGCECSMDILQGLDADWISGPVDDLLDSQNESKLDAYEPDPAADPLRARRSGNHISASTGSSPDVNNSGQSPNFSLPWQDTSASDIVDETSSREWYIREFFNVLMAPGSDYIEQIRQILLATDVDSHYGLNIEVMKLLETHVSLASVLLIHAEKLLLLFDEALFRAQQHLIRVSEDREKMSLKPLCHTRLTALPTCPSVYRPRISSIRNRDVGRFVAVVGTVIRTGLVKVLESQREYRCVKCGYQFNVYSAADQRNVFVLPSICPSRHANIGSKCRSRAFQYVEGSKICRDYQEIKIQESSHRLAMGSMPRSLIVILVDDLIDSCQAGDDVVVAGVVGHLWSSFSREQRCDLDLVLHANHVQVTNDTRTAVTVGDEHRAAFARFWLKHQKTPVIARSILMNSVCPQLCGVWIPRLAVLLTLIGGVARVDSNTGTRTRGQSHLLIIGDPGTGKSKLLQFASQVLTRSVSTTGTGTSNAGLTVAAVPDPVTGEWGLEAGALVLADGGICCIDEFGCMRDSDKSVVHEAMEQQTISVAKAGLVCTLHTRAAVFAIQNPKPVAYDLGLAGAATAQDLSLVTGIASPLLSRFDLILLLWDPKTDDWDNTVTKHILNALPEPEAHMVLETFGVNRDKYDQDDSQSEAHSQQHPRSATSSTSCTSKRGVVVGGSDIFRETEVIHTQMSTGDGQLAASERVMDEAEARVREVMAQVSARHVPPLPHWSFGKLQTYIHYVRGALEPPLTPRSNKVLMAYYNYQRASTDRAPALTSVRLLESLVRLAQAHARLMMHDYVTLSDAVHVVLLVDAAMSDLKNGPAPPPPHVAALRQQWDPTYNATQFRQRYWLRKQLTRLGFTTIEQYKDLALDIIMRDYEAEKSKRTTLERVAARKNPSAQRIQSFIPGRHAQPDQTEEEIIEQMFLRNAWPSTSRSSTLAKSTATIESSDASLLDETLVPAVPLEDLEKTPDDAYREAEQAILELFNLSHLRDEEPYDFDYTALCERLSIPLAPRQADGPSIAQTGELAKAFDTVTGISGATQDPERKSHPQTPTVTRVDHSNYMDRVEWPSESQDDAFDAAIDDALRDLAKITGSEKDGKTDAELNRRTPSVPSLSDEGEESDQELEQSTVVKADMSNVGEVLEKTNSPISSAQASHVEGRSPVRTPARQTRNKADESDDSYDSDEEHYRAAVQRIMQRGRASKPSPRTQTPGSPQATQSLPQSLQHQAQEASKATNIVISSHNVKQTHLRRALALYEPSAAYTAPSELDRARSKLYATHNKKSSVTLPTSHQPQSLLPHQEVGTIFGDDAGDSNTGEGATTKLTSSSGLSFISAAGSTVSKDSVQIGTLHSNQESDGADGAALRTLGTIRPRNDDGTGTSQPAFRRPSKRIAQDSDDEDE